MWFEIHFWVTRHLYMTAGGEKGIDEYYRQQTEMLDSFVEMDCIAEKGGYIPSTTQVSVNGQCESQISLILQCWQQLSFCNILKSGGWCEETNYTTVDSFLFISFSVLCCSVLQEERAMVRRGEKLAIQISNCANLVIFAAKVYACVRSGSLAIIASTLDSLLDLLSGFILWFTAISMRKLNPYLYPIGKKRMQPLVSLSLLSYFAIPFDWV